MKKGNSSLLSIITYCIFLIPTSDLFSQKIEFSSFSILSIGNAHYKNPSLFRTIPDIDSSASDFLSCLKPFSGMPGIMLSRKDRILTKVDILKAVKNYVDFVEQQQGCQNIGMIYYCGHGMADLAGSMYLIPGDIDTNVEDVTFEFLSRKLINMDDIVQIIIQAQDSSASRSQYIIMADCCSDSIPSKLYQGMSYKYLNSHEWEIPYDSTFLKNTQNIRSGLSESMKLRYDSLLEKDSTKTDSTQTRINEYNNIGEMVRWLTFEKNGNVIFYSSNVGKGINMVQPPNFESNYDVGPICRRTLLYFDNYKENALKIADYLKVLTDEQFDPLTAPAIFNRSRNMVK